MKKAKSPILRQFGIDVDILYETEETPVIQDTKNTSNVLCAKPIIFFCDGSAINNGSPKCKAGYAAVFPNHPHLTISGKLENRNYIPTNNRAEYMAFIKGMGQVDREDPKYERLVEVYTDSKLLMKTINEWLKLWKLKGWKKMDGNEIMNLDLVKEIDELTTKRKVICRHVKAHTGKKDWESIWNAKADELAQEVTKS